MGYHCHVPIAGLAYAGVVELVDAPDSKSGSARSVGSIPTTRTTLDCCHPRWLTAVSVSPV